MTEFDLSQTDELLSTTRAVRKRLDLQRPVDRETVLECLRIAIQAPTGGNSQGWRWVVVTDEDKRKRLAEFYREAGEPYFKSLISETEGDATKKSEMRRVVDSAMYLMDHLAEVPVHVIPCLITEPGDVSGLEMGASIYPAVWNFQLALRSRGLGSVITTLHLGCAARAAELLGIPDNFMQAGLIPVAYYTGDTFAPAKRIPIEEVAYWNHWSRLAST